MPELQPQELKLIGEKHVKDALLEDNFSDVKIQPAEDDFNYISANGVMINILLRITTSMVSANYNELSDQEKAQLISNAILQNRIAYAAYVTINPDGSLNGEISWHKLS